MLRKILCVVAAAAITALTLFLFVGRTPAPVAAPVSGSEAPTPYSGAPPAVGVQDLFNGLANVR